MGLSDMTKSRELGIMANDTYIVVIRSGANYPTILGFVVYASFFLLRGAHLLVRPLAIIDNERGERSTSTHGA